MRKLFSMKSLLFASVIAFLLTFATAPQAEAEEKSYVEIYYADYYSGILHFIVTDTENKLTETADGYGLYLSTAKEQGKLKYKTMINVPCSDKGRNWFSFDLDISSLLGKESILGIALDTDKTGEDTIRLTPAPSVKATFEDNDIKITVDGKEIPAGLTSKEFKSYKYSYRWRVGNGYPSWHWYYDDGDIDLAKAIKDAQILGSTIYISILNEDEENQYSPWSDEVKVKIPAKAKAPKISIKTAGLSKAFEWKMGSKVEYKVAIGDGTSAWTTGGGKAGWQTIIDNAVKAVAKENDTATLNVDTKSLVKGDAIASDIAIQVRTAAAGKKSASSISVVNLKKSLDSPTYAQIKVDTVNAKKKTATASAASISPGTVNTGYTAQYSTDGTKWKNITKTVTLESNKLGTGSTIQLRLVSNDKKTTVLPSAVTTVTIPDGKDGNTSVTSKRFVSDGTLWTEQTDSNYSQSASSTSAN